jgi:predicted transposase YdaD
MISPPAKLNRHEDRHPILQFIEAVLVYKFPKLTRQEVEAMFTHSDLKKTRVYQDAVLEGEQRGLQRQVVMLLRMLTRKFGKVSPRLKTRISKLSVIQLENLAEAIFDFETVADLNVWLKAQD